MHHFVTPKYRVFLLLCSFILLVSMKFDKPAYKLFDKKGKTASYAELLKDAEKADIIFFGEQHNNPVMHWLEYELTADLYASRGRSLMLGAEMFETDNQTILNEYVAGLVKEKNFESEARLWPNYKTDYKPLLNFARDSSLVFVATNVPRRYAALVNSKGFEALATLSPEARSFIAPLPVKFDPELACYKDIVKAMGDAPAHATANIAKSQALKDATMAHFILKNYKPGSTFLHFNGSYHSDNFQGIVWYIREANPGLRILTISGVEQKNVDDLHKEYEGRADYIIAVPESMTKTQ